MKSNIRFLRTAGEVSYEGRQAAAVVKAMIAIATLPWRDTRFAPSARGGRLHQRNGTLASAPSIGNQHRASPGVISAKAPQMPFQVEAAKAAPAVVFVPDLHRNPCSACLGAGVYGIRIVDDKVRRLG